MVQVEHEGNRDFQVQSNMSGCARGRTRNGRARTGHPVWPTGRRGCATSENEFGLLARVYERFNGSFRRHQWTRRGISRLDSGSKMKLLLDTHIWIWAIQSPERLSRRVRRELQRAGNELYLSPVSIWEAHFLERRQRLRVRPTFPEWLNEVFAQVPVREAPFTFAVATAASRIELPQADLGDLFLAATATACDLTLVTSDSQLLACSWLKTLSND
jgi:PIN domain nuclease of toxin-antitoxin system